MHALRRVSVSSGAAAPLGCVVFFASVEIAVCTPCTQGFLHSQCLGVSLLVVCFTHCQSVLCTGIKTANLLFSSVQKHLFVFISRNIMLDNIALRY